MSSDFVLVGCRLPQGYVIEVGLATTMKQGNGTIPFVQKGEDYERFEIIGTNANYRRTRLRLPASLNAEPHVNKVPAKIWERWKKDHLRSWVLQSQNLFEIPDAASIEAAKLDAQAAPAVLQPIDPSKPLKVGNDKVEPAKFDD